MHNCDQGVQNFTMGDSLGYFAADMDDPWRAESKLAHWLPQGHMFDMQPRNRILHSAYFVPEEQINKA